MFILYHYFCVTICLEKWTFYVKRRNHNFSQFQYFSTPNEPKYFFSDVRNLRKVKIYKNTTEKI